MDSAVLKQLGSVSNDAVGFAEICGEYSVVEGHGGVPSQELKATHDQAATKLAGDLRSLSGHLKATRPKTFIREDEKLDLSTYNLDALSVAEVQKIITLLHRYVYELVKHELPMCGRPARPMTHAH